MPFRSASERRYLFATDPARARRIARRYGAKVGGGFTKAQRARRAAKGGRAAARSPRSPIGRRK